MPKPNTMDDLEQTLRADLGLQEWQIRDLIPLITAKMQEVDRAARIKEIQHWLDNSPWHTQTLDEQMKKLTKRVTWTTLQVPVHVLQDRLAELRKDSNATKDYKIKASLKGGDV